MSTMPPVVAPAFGVALPVLPRSTPAGRVQAPGVPPPPLPPEGKLTLRV
jgi:hypothetical protein